MALQNLGVELLPLIAGIGVAGAGIALAMQGVLSNVVAGLTIIFTRPFRVGEYISIVGVEGNVETISMFKTTLNHADMSKANLTPEERAARRGRGLERQPRAGRRLGRARAGHRGDDRDAAPTRRR